MDGLASLLDECTLPVKTTVARIGNMLWPGRSQGRVFPPFLMAGTRTYVLARPEIGVQALARQARPFTIHTGGLGLFTGGKPIIYISIVKDELLMHFHCYGNNGWDCDSAGPFLCARAVGPTCHTGKPGLCHAIFGLPIL